MREETADWLEPMFLEADKRGIDTPLLMHQSKMPAAEADSPPGGLLGDIVSSGMLPPSARLWALDWVRFGQLLRRELGWDTYPAYPEFPEE